MRWRNQAPEEKSSTKERRCWARSSRGGRSQPASVALAQLVKDIAVAVAIPAVQLDLTSGLVDHGGEFGVGRGREARHALLQGRVVLVPPGSGRQREVIDTVNELNTVRLADTGDPEIQTRINAYEMAYRMQTSAPELMDLSKEPQKILDMYGAQQGKPSFAATSGIGATP